MTIVNAVFFAISPQNEKRHKSDFLNLQLADFSHVYFNVDRDRKPSDFAALLFDYFSSYFSFIYLSLFFL